MLKLDSVALEQPHRHHLASEQRFAIRGSASVDPFIGDCGAEGWVSPFLYFLGWHNVGVRHEHQPGIGVFALDTGDNVSPFWNSAEDFGLDAIHS